MVKSFRLFAGIALLCCMACEKEATIGYPVIVLSDKIDVTLDGISLHVDILNRSEVKNIIDYGFVWREGSSGATLDDYRESLGNELPEKEINAQISNGIYDNTGYTIRAYVQTSQYIIYSNSFDFLGEGSAAPEIISFEPHSGEPGSEIHIVGNNFNSNRDKNIVKLGNYTLDINSAGRNDLYVTVPPLQFSIKEKITVQVSGKTGISADFFTIISQWAQKATFPWSNFSGSEAFAVNGKGYVCVAYNNTLGGLSQALWEYDPLTDAWSRKTDLPGGGRFYHTAFTLENKAYIGLGEDYTIFPWVYYKDFWEYDPELNSWRNIADYPGWGQTDCVSFPMNGKGYVAGGYSQGSFSPEVWEYDPVQDSWTRKNDLTYPVASAMELSGTIYLADIQGGIYNYDPGTDSFTKITFRNNCYTFKGFALNGSLYYFQQDVDRTVLRYNCSANQWSALTEPYPFYHTDANLDFSIENLGYSIVQDEDGKMYAFDPVNF